MRASRATRSTPHASHVARRAASHKSAVTTDVVAVTQRVERHLEMRGATAA